MGKHRLITIGQVFGRWTVIASAPAGQHGRSRWWCRCQCGAVIDVAGASLNYGISRACRKCANRTHDASLTPEYRIWVGMRTRCYDKKHKKYKHYGGRGIGVATCWRDDFATWFAHVGPRPSPQHTLERIDNDKDYEPGNVRWATRREQARNTSQNRWITFRGETRILMDWAVQFGLTFGCLCNRLNHGWPIEQALTEPVFKGPHANVKRTLS